MDNRPHNNITLTMVMMLKIFFAFFDDNSNDTKLQHVSLQPLRWLWDNFFWEVVKYNKREKKINKNHLHSLELIRSIVSNQNDVKKSRGGVSLAPSFASFPQIPNHLSHTLFLFFSSHRWLKKNPKFNWKIFSTAASCCFLFLFMEEWSVEKKIKWPKKFAKEAEKNEKQWSQQWALRISEKRERGREREGKK